MGGYFRRLVRSWCCAAETKRNLSDGKPIRKRWRRVVRWIVVSISTVVFLAVVLLVLLLFPVVQTWLAGIVSKRVSEDLGITVRIDRLEIRPFAMNRLHGVFVADLRGDTLLAVDELRIRGLRVNIDEQRIRVRRLELYDTRFALATMKGDTQSNLTNLLDKLASGDTTSSGADWKVQCHELDIQRLHFSFNSGSS